jgi:hypothetical protein
VPGINTRRWFAGGFATGAPTWLGEDPTSLLSLKKMVGAWSYQA